MDELYFDTRNKKGQKYGNPYRYKKDKSIKLFKKLNRQISKERKTKNDKDNILYLDKQKENLTSSSWYRCVHHHHHCEMCHPYKVKKNKEGKAGTFMRIKEYKKMDFDLRVK